MIIIGKRTNQGFLTFNEWLLTESIKPKYTLFGTNTDKYDNNNILKIQYDGKTTYETYFIADNKLYTIQYNGVNTNLVSIGFGVSKDIPKTQEELDNVKLSHNKVVSISALDIFNKVFYIVTKTIFNLKKDIYFEAASDDLKNIYNKLIDNKYFNDELNKLGYSNLIKYKNKYISKYKG